MLKTRLFNFGEDYPEICEWWRERNWNAVRPQSLSPIGIVVYDDNSIKHCAAWLYVCDGTDMGWLEFVIANPKSPLKEKRSALELLVTTAMQMGKNLKLNLVYSMLSNENLIEIYEKCGFVKTPVPQTEMIGRLV